MAILDDIPFMLLLMIVPLIGALVCVLMNGKRGNHAKYAAISFSGITLMLSLLLLLTTMDSSFTASMGFTWIDTSYLRIGFDIGIDGMSLLMIMLTAALVLLVSIFSASEKNRPGSFFAFMLAMEVGLMGVFMAQDYFLFYIFWEVTLIPMFFLISVWGGPRRHYAAMKFFIYTHVASLIMLIGIFLLASEAAAIAGTGTMDFSFAAINGTAFGSAFQVAVFALFFIGFAAKMPLVPFHTWLPDAHVEAPTAGSVLLAGVMLKMGAYGIIRICFEALPEGAHWWQPMMIFMALLAIVYGAYACIAQKDLKKMVAFSSISHMGMVLLGMATLSGLGIEFAIFQMFAHGLISAVLFMVCGVCGHNAGTREIPLLGGLAGKMPIFAGFMMFSFLASLGLPGLAGFVAEFGIIFSFVEYLSAHQEILWILMFALSSLLLTAGYYTWAMQRSIFGKETEKIDLSEVHDVSRPEGFSMGVLCALIALFGIMPSLIMALLSDLPLVLTGVV